MRPKTKQSALQNRDPYFLYYRKLNRMVKRSIPHRRAVKPCWIYIPLPDNPPGGDQPQQPDPKDPFIASLAEALVDAANDESIHPEMAVLA